MKNKYTHTLTIMVILAISIGCSTTAVAQDKKQITGTVSDDTGPLLGASILIKNTSQGTTTDEDGRFALMAKSSDTLVFSYLGLLPQEIPVNLQTRIDVILNTDETSLDQVVINAGYYTISKREQTGNIARIGAKEIEIQSVTNPLQAMQGRVTGVDIVQNTGTTGAGFKVRIRGQNSLMGGNEPLYIIDGVPFDTKSLGFLQTSGAIIPGADISPLNAINPESIESIEILKDADATAIYGSKGANGVILITTKKGFHGKTRITVNSSSTIGHITQKTKLLNKDQYLEMRKEAFLNDGLTEFFPDDYDINGTWDQNRNTDWQKELLGGSAQIHKLSLSAGGGSETTNFLLGGQFQEETTVFPGDFNYKRINMNSTINHKTLDEKLNLSFTTAYAIEDNILPYKDFSLDALWLVPNAPALYDEGGNLNWENSTWSNPLAASRAQYKQGSTNLLANTVVSYSILDNMKIRINGGYNTSDLQGSTTIPHTIYDPAYGRNSSFSTLTVNNGRKTSWITEPQLIYDSEFWSGKWNFLLGTSFQENTYEQESRSGRGFPNNNLINNMSAASTHSILEENKIQYRYQSFFARINYSLNNTFFVNATGRRDGSSRFGTNNKYGNFGALGLAYVFSEHLKPEWINFGKIRGSVGVSGNDQIGDYQYLNTYIIQDFPYDGNIGLLPARLYNPDFKWEKINKREVTLEMDFFRNRLNFGLSYYNNLSTNQLINYALPATTGFTDIQSNLKAKIENSGWELEVNGKMVSMNKFLWNIALNLSIPKNKLLDFPGLENSTYANSFEIGQPLTIVKLYELKGVNSETGLFEFTDYNDDGAITGDADRKYIADLSPKFFGGFSNSLEFGNWNLDFSFQFVKKKGYNQYRYSEPPGLMINHFDSVMDRWQQPGDIASMQRFTTGVDYEAYLAYSRFTQSSGVISDISFIRLKSAQLAYNLLIEKQNDVNGTIFIQGQNLLTFSPYKATDPEQLRGYIPQLRQFTIGAQVSF